VLIQLTALRAALNKVGAALLVRHMEDCLREETGGREGADRARRLKEAVQMFLEFS